MRRALNLNILALLALVLLTAGCSLLGPNAGLDSVAAIKEGQAGTTLTASKTATGNLTRTYQWADPVKTANPTDIAMFTGDSAQVTYNIAVTRTGYTDVVSVSGTVTVTNGGDRPTEGLTIFDHVQYKVGGGPYQDLPGAYVTITPSVQLAPGQTGSYPYEIVFTPVAGATYKNVATVTITNHSGNLGTPFGPEPKTDFSVPSTPSSTVNATINVDDTNGGSWTFSDSGSVSYTRSFTTAGTFVNTATIRETGQSSTATVNVAVYDLSVTKNASTSFNRYWSWTVLKTADQTALTLEPYQTFLVNYSIVLGASFRDADWSVSGSINVYNPSPIPATLNRISDVLSDGTVPALDCSVTFPYTLAPGETLTCSYRAALGSSSALTNTASATIQNFSYAGGTATPSGETTFSGRASVAFGRPAEEFDECVTLSDTYSGGPQSVVVCGIDAPRTFTYSRPVGPYAEAGTYYVNNTASFVGSDGGTGSSSWTVTVRVPSRGCTLTFGYWKTHSAYGPAPYDRTWALVGEDTTFFLSGQSYYEVLKTSPAGNAYYQLAHQYIAAKLNELTGASFTAASSAFSSATSLLSTYTPQQVSSMDAKNSVRKRFVSLAGTLGAYNEGSIGPGHCSE